jgi:hypothetical protein
MAYPDPIEGFEGVLMSASEYLEPKSALGFAGFYFQEGAPDSGKRALGFEGFLIAYSDVERFILVTDFRGRPLKGVKVTAQNVGGNVSAISDVSGIVALEIDSAGTTVLKLEKNKAFQSYNYTHASETLVSARVFQPRLLT